MGAPPSALVEGLLASSRVERPLSSTQEAMLATHLRGADVGGINLQQLIVEFREPLDASRLRALWAETISLHAILRTAFSWDGAESPVQWIAPATPAPWEVHDHSTLSPSRQTARWQELLAEDRARGFDLSTPPLLRFTLVRLGREHWRLVWTYHHILLDGRGHIGVLAEVLHRYDAHPLPATSPPSRDVFGDFITWHSAWKQNHLPQAEAFWRNQLSGLASAPPLPWEKSPGDSRPATPAMHTSAHVFSTDSTRRLRDAASNLGVTANTLVQGAWALTLGLYTGTDDVIFGAVRSGRHGHVAGAQDAPGLFINTLPVRVRLTADQTTARWLADLRAQHLAVRPFEHTPPRRLRGWLPSTNFAPLFTSLVVCENHRLDNELRRRCGSPDNSRRFELLERSDYPLILSAEVDGEIFLRLAGDLRRFSSVLIDELLVRVRHFLEVFVTSPHLPLRELPLLNAEEHRRIVHDWNATHRAPPTSPWLHAGFEAQADANPAHLCLVDGDTTWTYADMDRRANQVAHHLRKRGLSGGDLVAVHLKKSPGLLAVILGVLKAGGAYVPIDPAIAQGRARWMINHAQARLIVTETALVADWDLPEATVIRLAESQPAILRETTSRPARDQATPQDLAYAIFTSGSTGHPKLIGVEHAQVANLLDYATRELLDADDLRVVPFIGTISFDSSVQQIFATLALGGTLVLQRDLLSLLRSPWASRFTSLGTAPSSLASLLDSDVLPKSIRVLGLGGEAIPPGLVARIQRLSHVRKALNYYGPTETTIYSTVERLLDRRLPHPVPDDARLGTPGRILGRPIQNTRIYVLDEALRPVPPGVTGEIYIGGAGVSRGYLSAPDLTAERFKPDPLDRTPGARRYRTGDLGRFLPDGTLEFIGRADTQFKLRGLRLEPEEIETHVLACPGVSQAVVTLHETRPGKPRLVVYVVAAETVTLVALHAFMRPRVPTFMLPAILVRLDHLPLTINGKVDRRALPAPSKASGTDPATAMEAFRPMEAVVAQIWRDLLGVRQVGLHDDFFALGGDSLLAVRMTLELEKRLGRPLPVSTLAQETTLGGLARLLAEAGPANPFDSLVPLQPLGDARPVFCLHGWGGDVYGYKHFAQRLAPHRPVYGLRATGLDDRQPRPADVEEMAALYAARIRAHQPEGPYILVGHSIAGWFAYAVAQTLTRQGAHVAMLALFDTGPTVHLPLHLHLSLRLPHFGRRIGFHLNRIRAIPRAEKLAYLRLRLRWLWFHARNSPQQNAPPSDPPRPDNAKADPYAAAVRRYKPAPYYGDLSLFVTRNTTPWDLRFWPSLAYGRIHLHRIAGDHLNVMDAHHAESLAHQFLAALQKSEAIQPKNNPII